MQVIYSLQRDGDRQQTWKLLLGHGRGDDVAATLNPAAGRGLTHLVRHGCALHQKVRGSGLGVAARLSDRVHVAAAHLVSGTVEPCTHVRFHTLLPLRAVSAGYWIGSGRRRSAERQGARGSCAPDVRYHSNRVEMISLLLAWLRNAYQRLSGSGVGEATRLTDRVHVAAAHLVSGRSLISSFWLHTG